MRPPQRSISDARNCCNSAGGGLSTGMVPIRTITSRTSGVAATALSSACSRSITGLGVADGAQIIVHPTASKPGTPDSAIVGTSGNAGTRAVELTPSARTLPALMWPTTLPASANMSNVTRHHVVERGRRAAIADAVHLGGGHALEQFGGEKDCRAGAAVAKRDLAGL